MEALRALKNYALILFVVLCVPCAAWQGNTHAATDSSGNTVVSTYDSSGNLRSVTDATGRVMPAGGAHLATTEGGKSARGSAKTAISIQSPITIHVPGDQPTIQAAINAANTGDTVLVSNGTYQENINFNGKAITVTSVNGSAVTTIDGGKKNTVVLFVTNEGAGSVLNGFTITNGSSGFQGPNFGEGGGIAVSNSSPVITNNVITSNGACNGSGIGIGFGGPLIQGNTISSNFQAGCGGGIGGGGISVRGESSNTRIIGNVIANNSMPSGGGGIALFAADAPIIQSNTFTGNNGEGEGGGISIVNNASPQIVNNLFIHNTASSGGGLWWLIPTSTPGILLLNNTIANNTAQQGSAIFADGFDSDAIFQNNAIIGIPGVIAAFCGNFNNTIPPNFVADDVFTTGATPYGGICTDQTGKNGNISSDPLFVDPAVDNYHEQPNSPTIDKGNNSAPIALPATDLDGNPRIVNGTVDIGAFEFQGTTTTNFSTTSLTFSAQLVGTTSPPQMITITNTGSNALQIIPFTLTGDYSETDTCHTSSGIAAGKSCVINVSFAPTARGTRAGQLTVTSNDAASPTTINLSGTGIAPVVSLSKASLTFNAQLVGSTSGAQAVTLSNIGDATLVVNNIAASGDFGQSNDCGGSVAMNSHCTINTTFSPTVRGLRAGAVTITDSAAGSPHGFSLQGTAIGPAATLGPSLSFSGQLVGTTSAAQVVTLSSTGETPLTINKISTSGDFGQTSNCPSPLPNGQSCTIQVTFMPTATGTRNGTLSVADNSTTSPEQVGLNGNGADFSIAVQPGSNTIATVSAGGAGIYNLSVSGSPGLNAGVTFSCSGAPLASTCSINPSSVTLNGATPVNFNVMVATTARSSAVPLVVNTPRIPPLDLSVWGMALILAMGLARASRSRKARYAMLLAGFGTVLLLIGCGGGGGGGGKPVTGTPAGTSTITVTATSGSATRTFNLTLNVE